MVPCPQILRFVAFTIPGSSEAVLDICFVGLLYITCDNLEQQLCGWKFSSPVVIHKGKLQGACDQVSTCIISLQAAVIEHICNASIHVIARILGNNSKCVKNSRIE